MSKNIFILLLTTIVSVCSFAQKSYTTFDGHVWSVGDEVTMGYPSDYSGGFSSLYVFGDDKILWRHSVRGVQIQPMTKFEIQDIVKYHDYADYITDDRCLLVLGHSGSTDRLFLDPGLAISYDEVALSTSPTPEAETAVQLSPVVMMAYCIRVNKLDIDDDMIMVYVKEKMGEEAKEYEDNKFKFEREKAQLKQELQKMADDFDFSKVYKVNLNFSIQDYDFERKGYPCDYYPMVLNAHYDKDLLRLWSAIQVDGTYKVHVGKEYDNLFFFPLSPEKAEAYEQNCKAKKRLNTFYPIGSLYAALYLRLLDSPPHLPEPKQDTIAEKIIAGWGSETRQNAARYVLNAHVMNVDIFGHSSCRYNYLGSLR